MMHKSYKEMEFSAFDQKKRKCQYGSAEKSRKHNKDDRYPYCRSPSSEKKSWGDMMDQEDLLRENRQRSSRRRIPLSAVDDNKKSHFIKKQQKAVVVPVETDERKLRVRQRQIDIGKNTEGYKQYVLDIDRTERTKDHPWTPDKLTVCSTRSWQGVMRIWRRKLHFWDPPSVKKEQENSFLNISASSTSYDAHDIKVHLDNSVEVEDCLSEYSGSQASSNGDDQLVYEASLFDNALGIVYQDY